MWNRFHANERQHVKMAHKQKKKHGNTSSRKYLLDFIAHMHMKGIHKVYIRRCPLPPPPPPRTKWPPFHRRHFQMRFHQFRISLKFAPKGLIDNKPALVQLRAWRRPGNKPLPQPMLPDSMTHMCGTRRRWAKCRVQENVNRSPLGSITIVARLSTIIGHQPSNQSITLTPYMVLPLFATRFADYAEGIRGSFIQPRLF